jgi:hypothetical protein
MKRCLLVGTLGLLTACAGDDCWSDDQCLSRSCTWGTCDLGLLNALDSGHDDDDELQTETHRSCVRETSCEFLYSDSCEQAAGCYTVFSSCMGYIECDLLSETCDDCYSRGEAECHGECTPWFDCAEAPLDCDERDPDRCEERAGCRLIVERY